MKHCFVLIEGWRNMMMYLPDQHRQLSLAQKLRDSPEESCVSTVDDYPLFFYRQKGEFGILSQWYTINFDLPYTHFGYLMGASQDLGRLKAIAERITFVTAEQYMMFCKALLFGNYSTAAQILETHLPSHQKRLGRSVRGFKECVWQEYRLQIVENANYAKFSQNDAAKCLLLSTGNRELVEASPTDAIWGIGYSAKDASRTDRRLWGQNLLGKALMAVRHRLKEAGNVHMP